MSTQYLHGIEVITSTSGNQSVNTVKTSVIGLIGIAPLGATNALILCLNAQDDAQFGALLPGFGIPRTLDIIRQAVGSTPVFVINIFNPATHTEQVTDEVVTVANGAFKLAFAPIGAVVFTDESDAPVTYVKDQDYTLDVYGNFTAIGATIANGISMKASYKKLDVSTVTDAAIIGGVDGNGVRTGLSLFEIANNRFGYGPKILIAPYHIESLAICAAVSSLAAKIRAVYLVDAPKATTVTGAIAARGVGSVVAGFASQDGRAQLLYPYLQSYDPYIDDNSAFPYSAFYAALMVYIDNNFGYWYSPSNNNLPAIATGIDKDISFNINDTGCDANQLNGAGVTTVATGYGMGLKAWGNRNASFPNMSGLMSFFSMQRLDDVVAESLQINFLPYVDKPIVQAFVDIVKRAGIVFLNTLIQRGAVQPGSTIVYSAADSDLPNGLVAYINKYAGAPPAERMNIINVVDSTLVNAIQ